MAIHPNPIALEASRHAGRSQAVSAGGMRNNPIIVQEYGGACLARRQKSMR
jgi:hypothetical protein